MSLLLKHGTPSLTSTVFLSPPGRDLSGGKVVGGRFTSSFWRRGTLLPLFETVFGGPLMEGALTVPTKWIFFFFLFFFCFLLFLFRLHHRRNFSGPVPFLPITPFLERRRPSPHLSLLTPFCFSLFEGRLFSDQALLV